MDITRVNLQRIEDENKDDWWQMSMYSGRKRVYPRPGQQAERCRTLAATAAMVPGAAERFQDETGPGLAYYEGHGKAE